MLEVIISTGAAVVIGYNVLISVAIVVGALSNIILALWRLAERLDS